MDSEVKLVAMFLTEGLKLDFEAGHPKQRVSESHTVEREAVGLIRHPLRPEGAVDERLNDHPGRRKCQVSLWALHLLLVLVIIIVFILSTFRCSRF